MSTFSFSTVRITLENLGFCMNSSEEYEEIAIFTHPKQRTSVLLAFVEMDGVYLRSKMNEINLPYEYFKSLATSVRYLKKK